MLVNCWRTLSRWITAHAPRMIRSRASQRRRPTTVWAGVRQAAPLSIEPLEARSLLSGESFLLHSLPGATKRIYLDFNGHTTSGTLWNSQFTSGADIVSTALSLDGDTSTFTAAEEQLITDIWRIVSEDFSPFNIDVTTQDPGIEALRKVGGSDTEWGVRVVIGGNSGWYPSGGAVGVAYLTSFNYSSDTPVFAFADRMPSYSSAPFMAWGNTITHEVGHSMGLTHDGISTNQTFGSGAPADYYYGHYTNGATAWGPIMGSPVIYNQMLSQWSKGEYSGATNTQDDLSIITSQNGFDYRVDDVGSDTASAADVTITDTHNASASGIIERNTDTDYFKFYVQQAGTVNIQFKSALSPYFTSYNAIVSDLDIAGTLYNSAGQVVATNSPTNSLEASISSNLTPGIYYLSIDGVGYGDPASGGYSDYGSLGQYAITLTTSTGILSIAYPNTAPTNISLSNSTIAENVALSTPVGTLSTTDVDSNNTFTYSLVTGSGSADNAKFSISGSNLTTNASLDYETQSSYSVRVRTTDQGGLTFEKIFTITLTNVNEAPTNISLSAASIAENNSASATVGTLSATDPDAANTFTYTLVGGTGSTDNNSFSITGNSLQVTPSTNYESKNSYSIRVQVTDQSGLTYEKQFTISVTNTNESPTDLTLSSTSIAENNSANATLGTLGGVDEDSGSTFTFSLVSGTGSTDNSSLSIVGNSLRITPSTNFEAKSSYSIRLRVTDQTGLTFEKPFSITVTNVNESPTDISLSSTTLAENNAPNSVVGNLGATDPDSGAAFTYSLVTGTGSTDNASFSVVSSNLIISQPADFETQPSYSVRICVTDQGGLSFEKVFTITISDVNDAPIDINLSTIEITENNSANTQIGLLTALDPDAGSTFTYSLASGLGGDDNLSFSIFGNALLLTPSANFETQDTYSVRVRVTDQGGLNYEESFVIDVLDENEAPTDIALSSTLLDENNLELDAVGLLSAVDPDSGNSFTFDLVTGAGDTDNADFMIIGNELCINTTADFETRSSYSVRLLVTDQDGLTYEKPFTITVNDVNETPTDIFLSATNVTENNVPFEVIGALSATDPDAESLFTFELATGNGDADNIHFLVLGDSLVLAESANFELQHSYSIRVRVTDLGGLWTEREFVIGVIDANDPPDTIEIFSPQVSENNLESVVFAYLTAGDPDPDSTFTYALVPGLGSDDNVSFAINTADIILLASANYEVQDTYFIRIQVTDESGLSFEQTFTIEVLDLAEPPTDIELSSTFITENNLGFDTVGFLSAIDEDFGDQFTFELVDGPGAIDNDAFEIVGDALKIAASTDFEAQETYSIRVLVTDSAGLTFEKELNIEVLDDNEAPTDISLSGADLAEDNLPNEVVGTFDGIDPDAGDFLTFAFVAGPGSEDNGSFAIVGDQLTIIPSADFETKDTYSIRVAAVDQNGLSLESEFAITVNDISEAPTDISVSSAGVPEHSQSGTIVGILSAIDDDANEWFTFELVAGVGDVDNGLFSIDGDLLVLDAVPDFESQSSYAIRVQVTDAGGLTLVKVGSVSVTDMNDFPTVQLNQSFMISEGSSNGGTVGTVIASDPDGTSPNNSLTYVIAGGNFGNAFVIDELAGELSVHNAAVLDFETMTQYTLQIAVTDGGVGNLTATQTVLVDITNVNEGPMLDDSNGFSLPENSLLSTAVGTMAATDPDVVDTLTFSIIAGNAQSAFAIDPQSGLLTVTNPAALNYEVTHSFTLTIQVADIQGVTDTTDVTISLTDIDETHQLQLGSSAVTWINRQPHAVVLPQATVVGIETLGGGTLTITVNAVGTAKKLLDQFGFSGTAALGTSSGPRFANGQLTLQIGLDTDTTASEVQSFLRKIAFSTKGKGLKLTTRTLHVSLLDGAGSSSAVSQTINVRKKP